LDSSEAFSLGEAIITSDLPSLISIDFLRIGRLLALTYLVFGYVLVRFPDVHPNNLLTLPKPSPPPSGAWARSAGTLAKVWVDRSLQADCTCVQRKGWKAQTLFRSASITQGRCEAIITSDPPGLISIDFHKL
jgi:hypothetical protein